MRPSARLAAAIAGQVLALRFIGRSRATIVWYFEAAHFEHARAPDPLLPAKSKVIALVVAQSTRSMRASQEARAHTDMRKDVRQRPRARSWIEELVISAPLAWSSFSAA